MTGRLSAASAAPGVPLTPRHDRRVLDFLRSGIAGRLGGDCREHYVAPPVIAQQTVERAGFAGSFPHLLGAVHAAPDGGAAAATDLVLTPAACHHLYPLLAGIPPEATLTLSVEAVCFRAEAACEPGRLRSFRMYEIVHLGPEPQVVVWRDGMLSEAVAWLAELDLATETVAASDPFLGRPGALLARMQRSQQLKWEITAEVAEGTVQAVASANCHRDHFGVAFGLTDGDGGPLHSACLGFGLERLALALRHRHGPDPTRWLPRLETRR